MCHKHNANYMPCVIIDQSLYWNQTMKIMLYIYNNIMYYIATLFDLVFNLYFYYNFASIHSHILLKH